MSRPKPRKSGSSPKRTKPSRRPPHARSSVDTPEQRAVLVQYFKLLSRKAVGTPEVPPPDADRAYWDALEFARSTSELGPMPPRVLERMGLSHLSPDEESAWRAQWQAELDECLRQRPASIDEAFQMALSGAAVPEEGMSRPMLNFR